MKKIRFFPYIICFLFLTAPCVFSQEEDVNLQETENSAESSDTEKDAVTTDSENAGKTQADADTQKSDEKEKKIPKYEYILDESNALHIHAYEDENVEYLTVNKSKFIEGRTVVIYSKENLKRFFYDKDFYLDHAEIWQTAKKASDYKIKKKIYYEYSDKYGSQENSDTGFSHKTFEIDYENQIYSEYIYNKKNLLIEQIQYDIKDLNISPDDVKFDRGLMQKKMVYYYLYKDDEKDRILMESETHCEYYKNSSSIKNKNTRRNVYEYIRVDCPPSKTFYENDVLRLKIVYTSKKDYVQYVYFDNETYVRTEYVKGKKHLEIFYSGGEEKLRKNYD